MGRTLTRGFAAGNPFDEMMADADAHSPPITLYGANARFANAAYRAASRDGVLDTIQADLDTVNSLVNNDADVANFFADPSIKEEDKLLAVKEMSDEAGFHEITAGLLEVIAENGKLKDMDKIHELFGSLMDAKNGLVQAVVTSASDLTKKDLKTITGVLEKRLEKGKKLQLTTKVDATIIGGLVVEIGDELADLSAASSLQQAGAALKAEE